MVQDRSLLYKKLNYTVHNDSLFKTALTHCSASSINNERLEFLGDAILDFLIAKLLLEKFPEASEGQLSHLRSTLVCEDTLAKIATQLDIDKYLYLGIGEIKTGGNKRKSILADALEACIAAIYIDSSIEQCSKVINYIYHAEFLTLSIDSANKDYKTQLQELLQAKKAELPKYNLINTKGAAHNHTFYISCTINTPYLSVTAEGKTKRQTQD